MRILAVEDNRDLRTLLEEYLKTQEHEYVRTASSGADALDVIHNSPVLFDCFLLDIQMPEMSGVELITHIRQIKGYEFAPIIMLTGVKNSDSIAKAFVAGAWDYIVKPFEFFDLEARIHGAELRNADFVRHIKRPHESPSQADYAVLQELALERPMSPDALSKSGLVPEDAFENCLMRMQSELGGGMEIAVIVVQNFAEIMASLQNAQQSKYTVALARELTKTLSPLGLIVTYRSNGVFAALLPEVTRQPEMNLNRLVTDAIKQFDSAQMEQSPEPAKVQVGYCRTNAFSTVGDTMVSLDKTAKDLGYVAHR